MKMNCIKINYTCCILGRVPLANPSISFHCCAGKSTLIFSYQLYAIVWTFGSSPNRDALVPGKLGCLDVREYFCFRWRRVVSMCHGGDRFKEVQLFPETDLKNGLCGSAPRSFTTYHLPKVWYGHQCGIDNTAHFRCLSSDSQSGYYPGFFISVRLAYHFVSQTAVLWTVSKRIQWTGGDLYGDRERWESLTSGKFMFLCLILLIVTFVFFLCFQGKLEVG